MGYPSRRQKNITTIVNLNVEKQRSYEDRWGEEFVVGGVEEAIRLKIRGIGIERERRLHAMTRILPETEDHDAEQRDHQEQKQP